MRLRLLGGLGTVAAVGCLLAAPDAHAHPVTVDGNATEWFTRIPNADNLALIARDATHQGEYVWRDNIGDARTDVSTPEVVGDIAAFQATGTTDGVAFLVRRQPGVALTGAPIQVQIAIDTDRVAGSGQEYFADFADTKVADGARWEYLVETLFGSGGTAAVKDTGFNAVASVPAVQGAAGDIEIFVPWTLLGMSGPPASPLRFTVAAFRAQNTDQTIDIGGASISNAVDAVTDYGNPAVTGYPNTWIDVQDQVVDYSFDLWFSTSGEVYSPIVIQRFIASPVAAGSDEWFVLRNVTGSTLSLTNFKLGDEETPDAGEGMKLFPAAATIAGGATFAVAANGTSYQTFYGVAPDAELTNSSAAIPDMTSFAPWATGSIGLVNGGDELLLLDRSNTLLDIAVYGSGAYAGITSYTPTPGADVALQRDTQSSDTDDCKVDFTAGTQCASNSQCSGSCRECVAYVCQPKAAGTSCADNDLCNGGETCDGNGACQTGTALDCNDTQPCTIDSCSATTGCVHVNEAAGTSCSNNDVCDGFEACDATGVCQSGTPLSCADSDPCTVDTCDSTSGCAHTQAQAGTSCSDGNACNGAETCNSGGSCISSEPLDCNDANPCTADSCVTASGCVHTPLASGTACGNGNVCDGDETCNASGTCVAGTPLSCGDGNDCTTDSCDPSTGCAHANETLGTACTGSGCTGQCDSTGDCVCGTGGAGGAGGSGGTGGTAGAAGSGGTGGAGGAAGTGGDGGAAGTAGSAGTGGDGGAAGAGTGGAAGSAGTGGDGGAAGAGTGGAAGSGGAGGATGGSGGGTAGTGGGTSGSGGASDAGVGGTGGSPSLPATSAPKDEGGCGCSTPGQSQAPSGYWLVAMMGAALTWMRSKAKRRTGAKH